MISAWHFSKIRGYIKVTMIFIIIIMQNLHFAAGEKQMYQKLDLCGGLEFFCLFGPLLFPL